MKKIILLLIFVWLVLGVNAQNDTIYFSDGKIEGCTVSKITDKTVEYSYPGESLINEVKKSTISQIKFASGRTQIFESTPQKTGNHGEFWGIEMGCNVKDFIEQLKAKGARFLEYQDDDEVKLEAQFMAFSSCDIYVHYNADKIVTYVDVQQNHSGKNRKEMQGIIEELNSTYTLVKEGGRPWLIAIYNWQWDGGKTFVKLWRATGYTRPHLCFYDTVFGIPEEDED